MLKTPELAMNPDRKVTTVCYGKKQENTTPTDNGDPYAGTPDDPLF